MLQNEYELVIIIRPDLEDAETAEVIDKTEAVITENGGSILVRDDWGNRKLAYPIRKHLKGHYVLIHFVAPAPLIGELERRIRITDKIIRFLTVKKADDVDVELRKEQAAEQRRLREEEERARAEAAAARAALEAEYGDLDDDDDDPLSDDDDDDDDDDDESEARARA